MSIADLRREYSSRALDEGDVDRDPVRQFRRWFDEALAAELVDANAMTLATASATGRPSARIVLLKEVDEAGFVFFTNYESAKAADLAANPHACLLFFWVELERQVRITGTVERVSREASEEYFRSRPLESRIGAWASPQSTVLEGREILEARVRALTTQYADGDVPLPAFWGGYRVRPEELEFWQGRPSRLHDRLRYRRVDSDWRLERLSP
ncbi:MAG: pyridoxamine 5'-phosphate oxidase [Vicinamibacterales bacterium]|nr:pyridoxamine 5'-phosphate oxidase [Vicinamibacterales bacterium]